MLNFALKASVGSIKDYLNDYLFITAVFYLSLTLFLKNHLLFFGWFCHVFAVDWTIVLIWLQAAMWYEVSGWPAVLTQPHLLLNPLNKVPRLHRHYWSFMRCFVFDCAMCEDFPISCSHFDNSPTLFIFTIYCLLLFVSYENCVPRVSIQCLSNDLHFVIPCPELVKDRTRPCFWPLGDHKVPVVDLHLSYSCVSI